MVYPNGEEQPTRQFGRGSVRGPHPGVRLSVFGGHGVARQSCPADGEEEQHSGKQDVSDSKWYMQQLEGKRSAAARVNFDQRQRTNTIIEVLSVPGPSPAKGISPNGTKMRSDEEELVSVAEPKPVLPNIQLPNQDARCSPDYVKLTPRTKYSNRMGSLSPKAQRPTHTPPTRDKSQETKEIAKQWDAWMIEQLDALTVKGDSVHTKEGVDAPAGSQDPGAKATMDKGLVNKNKSDPTTSKCEADPDEDEPGSTALLPLEEMQWWIDKEDCEPHLRLCARHLEHKLREMFPAANTQRTCTNYPVAWGWAGGAVPTGAEHCNCSEALTISSKGPVRALAEIRKRFGIWAQVILIHNKPVELCGVTPGLPAMPKPPPKYEPDDDEPPRSRQPRRVSNVAMLSYGDSLLERRKYGFAGCHDAKHCIFASACKDTELRNDASALGQNMLLYIDQNVLKQAGVCAIDPGNGAISFSTVFTSTRAAQARNVSGSFDLVFPGTFPQREVINAFIIEWSRPLLVNESNVIGDATLAASGMIKSREAAERIAIDLNVAPNIANILCHDIPVSGVRYDNSGFYMIGFLIWFQLQTLEDSEAAGAVWAFRAINLQLQAFRNYNDPNAQQTLENIRNDDLLGALVFNSDNLTDRDILVICNISSGLPRIDTVGAHDRAPQQYFRGGEIPVRFYSRAPVNRPGDVALSANDIWATLARLAEFRGERAEYTAGYMRASLLSHGGTATSGPAGHRQLHWTASTLEMDRYVCPRPHDTLILWRWLSLMQLLPNPMDEYISSQEYSVVRNCQDGRRRLLGAAVAGLYTTMASHALNQVNFWGAEMNAWMSQRPTEATAILNGLLIPAAGASNYTFQAIVLTQIKEWTGAVASIYAVANPYFGTRHDHEDLQLARSHYVSLGAGVPRLGDLPSMAFLMPELPREWGLFSQKVSWDMTAEIMTGQAISAAYHGIYLRYGDKRYHPGSSADAINKCSLYVSYGILAINCIFQATDSRDHPNVSFEYINRGLDATLGPHAPVTPRDRQPEFHEELQVVIPGTLKTYQWGENFIMAPVLLQVHLPIMAWDYMTNHPKQDPVMNAGYMWKARPTNLPGFDPHQALDGMLGGTSSRVYNIRTVETAPSQAAALTQVHAPAPQLIQAIENVADAGQVAAVQEN